MAEAPIVVGAMILSAVPVAAAFAPPIGMLVFPRWSGPAFLLHLGALGLLAAWVHGGLEGMERADRTGGAGSILAGVQWLIAAALAAAGSVWWTWRAARRRRAAG